MPNEAGEDWEAQSKEGRVFFPLTAMDTVGGRVLDHIMTKLRSTLQSKPGQIMLCCDCDTSVSDKKNSSRAQTVKTVRFS